MRFKSILLYWLPVLIWTGFIFSLSLKTNPVSVLPQPVRQEVQRELPKKVTIDLGGHIAEYAILGVLLVRLAAFLSIGEKSPFMSLGWALLASALVALLDESIQELVPGRAFELSDLGWDFLAASLGAMLLTLFLALLPGKLRAVFIT